MPTKTVTPCREVKDGRWEDLLRHDTTNQGGEYLCFVARHECTGPNQDQYTLDKLTCVLVCPRCKRPGRCGKIVAVERPLTLKLPFLCGQKIKGLPCGFAARVEGGFIVEV